MQFPLLAMVVFFGSAFSSSIDPCASLSDGDSYASDESQQEYFICQNGYSVSATCPAGYYNEDGQTCDNCNQGEYFKGICYTFHDDMLSPQAAQASCEADGAVLAAPDTEEKDTFLHGRILALNMPFYDRDSVSHYGPWIGYSYIGGSWVWSTGSSPGYTNWKNGQPNLLSREHWAFQWYYHEEWFWGNIDDHFELPYICEAPPTEQIPITPPCQNKVDGFTFASEESQQDYFICQNGHSISTTCPSGYYNEEDQTCDMCNQEEYFKGTCYSFHNDMVSPQAAQASCEADGAVLAAPDTEEKNAFLLGRVQALNMPLHEQTADRFYGPWIGYSYIGGSWVWSTGSSSEYTDWKSSEPNMLNTQHWTFCYLASATVGDWHWGNIADNVNLAYICEAPPTDQIQITTAVTSPPIVEHGEYTLEGLLNYLCALIPAADC